MSCPRCGAPSDATAQRFGLIAHRDPARVNYRGAKLPLTNAEAAILEKLVRFGRAGHEVLSSADGRGSLRVQVNTMRKKLPAAVDVLPLYGWGYELVER